MLCILGEKNTTITTAQFQPSTNDQIGVKCSVDEPLARGRQCSSLYRHQQKLNVSMCVMNEWMGE